MSITIKFWGVRGSLPTSPSPTEWNEHIAGLLKGMYAHGVHDEVSAKSYLQRLGLTQVGGFGTATTCVELISNQGSLIIDGGSGIKHLSDNLMSGAAGRVKGRYNIFMTHFHWDHVIGLPFFSPHFIPGCEIHYYGVQDELEEMIRGVFRKPYFPVPFEQLKAKIVFHKVEPRVPFKIEDLTCTPYLLDHPDECWGLKVQVNGRCYSHCVDTEGTRVSPEELKEDLPLYQNVDLLYFDAQYALNSLADKVNWGHSAAQVGLDIAIREKIPQVLFAHHDPSAKTADIVELGRQTQQFYDSKMDLEHDKGKEPFRVKWAFVHEGMEVKL